MKNEKKKKIFFIVIIAAIILIIAIVICITVFALKNTDKENNEPTCKETISFVEKLTTEELTTAEKITDITTENVTTEELTTEEARTEDTTTDEAITEDTTTEEGATEETTAEEVTREEPTTQESTTERPTQPPVQEEPMRFSVEDGVLYQYNSKKKDVVESGLSRWGYELSPNRKAVYYTIEENNKKFIRIMGKERVEIQLEDAYWILAALYDTGEAYISGETKYDSPIQWCRTPIYYFDGNQIHVVTDRAPSGEVSAQPTTIAAKNTPILIFQQYESNDSDVVNDYEIAIKGEVNYIDLKDAYDFTFTDNGNKMWYRIYGDYVYDEEKNSYVITGSDLYEIKINSGKISQPRLVDTDTSSVKAEFDPSVFSRGFVCLGEDLVYFKNAITLVDVEYSADGNYVKPIQTADMYIDGRLIDTDVVPNNAIYISDKMYYFTDWDVENGCGILTQYSNGVITQLATGVNSFHVLENGDVKIDK